MIFGTSVACDIVLSGEGISPVQGRIRWKKGRYRVEASPDAEYVVINGHKMTSSGLNQGDEMTVGRCRLFMLRLDETLEARPAGRKASAPTRSEREFWTARHTFILVLLGAPPPLEESPRPDRQALRRGPRSRPSNATIGCKISA